MGEFVHVGRPPASEVRGKSFPSKKFARVAKLLWPSKTAAELAHRAGVSERMAKYWLSGKFAPSPRALLAVLHDLIA
jgi:transcriptional regulator with XRE-family HTH domain